jgi:putative restriction endonuclease
MSNTKKRNAKEIYEDYWALTVGHTDYFDKDAVSFKILKFLSDRIDKGARSIQRGDGQFYKLQDQILEISPKSQLSDKKSQIVSIRKEINQFIKIGFIEPHHSGKNSLTNNFLSAGNERKKKRIFSQILLDHSKFKCSTTDSKDQRNHMTFFLRTLEENDKLFLTSRTKPLENDRDDIQALMMFDISKSKTGYLNRDELNFYFNKAKKIDFKKRKYNQCSYFKNFLRKMIDLRVINNPENKQTEVYFIEDADSIFGKMDPEFKKRDNYKHRLWVNDLKNEANGKCMVDKISPRVTGSHIKSWKDCRDMNTENQAYDVNNGLLLNKELDDLFDNNLISFENNGSILFTNKEDKLGSEKIDQLKKLKLDIKFLNPKRCEYLKYHRNKMMNH